MQRNEQKSAASQGAEKGPSSRRQVRHATLFDAVAGRVSTRGFISQPSQAPENENPEPFSTAPLRPEEVLFRRLRAPTRYMENDFYFANELLGPEHPLPDSDLLKAIHTYTSDLYTYATPDRGRASWRSMDETALIALGILLEETAKESLEETGDMVFVEGEDIRAVELPASGRESIPSSWGRKRADTASSAGLGGREDELIKFREINRRKRRRIKGPADEADLNPAGT